MLAEPRPVTSSGQDPAASVCAPHPPPDAGEERHGTRLRLPRGSAAPGSFRSVAARANTARTGSAGAPTAGLHRTRQSPRSRRRLSSLYQGEKCIQQVRVANPRIPVAAATPRHSTSSARRRLCWPTRALRNDRAAVDLPSRSCIHQLRTSQHRDWSLGT